jgi:predicted DsbA family dithiol-disulfide isomerase
MIERRTFPLRPEPDPTVTFKGTYREAAWQRAAAASKPDGIRFTMWARDDYPTWSLPALEAAKCAALQGADAFERVHLRLFEAFFSKGMNIGKREEVIEVVRGTGVDMNRFLREYEAGTARPKIMEEYGEAVTVHRVNSIPTVIFNGKQKVVGATPVEEYLKILAVLGIS